jgi:hypothetical protein
MQWSSESERRLTAKVPWGGSPQHIARTCVETFARLHGKPRITPGIVDVGVVAYMRLCKGEQPFAAHGIVIETSYPYRACNVREGK